jgi:hypothetical protein|tara:strand:- start:111 stop:320 length:210 start_codon:yes stop_codon:yes gene_type:complete
VKKNDQDDNLINSDFALNKNTETEKIKTTNVNILLNRVRLDQRRTLKKRIVFSLFLIGIISSLAIYFII